MHTRVSTVRKQGQALVEFALILPVVLFLIFGIIDFGRLLLAYTSASANLREAARYATTVGQVGTKRYMDCTGMNATARNVFFVNSQTVTINYAKASNGAIIPCGSITDAQLVNGDMLRITSSNTVNLLTPFLSGIWPSITLNFAAQRTIVKEIELVEGAGDTEPDGLNDAWETSYFGGLDQTALDDPDNDGCNNGCEEAVGTDPTNPDTDGDSTNSCSANLNDGRELFFYGTDPTLTDTDGDGIEDGEEICAGTDPTTFEPKALDDAATILTYGTTNVPILLNDVAQVPTEITIVSFDTVTTQGGTVIINTNGTVGVNLGWDDFAMYTPRPGFVGTDTFTYTITDSSGISSTATVSLSVNPGIATPVPSPTPPDIVHAAPFLDPVLNSQPQSLDWWRLNKGAAFLGYDDWQVEWWNYSGSTIADVDTAMLNAPCTTTQASNIPLTFNWGSGAPSAGGCGIAADNFAARFTRSFGTDTDFTAAFKVMADDAVEILIDGVGVLSNWALGGGLYESTFTHTFTGGVMHTIVVKYAELNGNAMLVFAPHDGSNDDRGVCGWAMDGSDGYNGAPAWTDFPNRDYYSYSRCHLELRGAVNLAPITNPELSFWEHWVLADANDTAWIEVRQYGGGTPWYGRQLHAGAETQPAWTRQVIDLKQFNAINMTTGVSAGTLNFTGKQIEFRFTLIGGQDAVTASGWWVDEIRVDVGTPDIFTIPWLDTMDSGNLVWLPGGSWAITSEKSRSGANAWSDSPVGTYMPAANYILELDGEVDVTTATDPLLVFYHSWNLGAGDSIYVEYSTNSGATWAPIGGAALETASTNTALVRREVSLNAIKATRFQIRFRLSADADANVGDGWYIDDVELAERDLTLEKVPFSDNVNNATNSYWFPDGAWAMTPLANHGTGGGASWTDTPGAAYLHRSSSSLRSQRRFNIAALANAELTFWHRRDIGVGDGLYAEISTDFGQTWTPIWSYAYQSSGTNPEAPDSLGTANLPWTEFNRQLAWQRVSVNLDAYKAAPFYLRFRMDAMSDAGVADGAWIDDIAIGSYTESVYNLPFTDDMDGTTRWYMGGSWANSSEDSHAGGFAMNDSPGTQYAHDTWSILQLIQPLNLTGLGAGDRPILSWWDRYALAQNDYARVQVSVWNGANWSDWGAWQEVDQTYFQTNTSWTRHQVDLSAFKGKKIRLRFVLDALSDASVADGWYIDDVAVALYNPAVYSLPFTEDANSLDGWNASGTWTTSLVARGSGASGLSAGAWQADFYDLTDVDCATFATDADKAAAALGGASACGTPYPGNPVALGDIKFSCAPGQVPDPLTGACSATPWIAQHLAIRFVRTFTVTETGTYDFIMAHNDGIRLYVYPTSGARGTPRLDIWSDVPDAALIPADITGVPLAAGNYIIELWYYQATGNTTITLDIDRPGTSFYVKSVGTTDDMTITLDGVIDLNGAANPTLTWYDRYSLADTEDCIVPEVSLPDRDFGTWIAVVATPFCGPAVNTTLWQAQSANLRTRLENRYGAGLSFTGVNRYLALRFRLYADNPGNEWWVEDIQVTGP